MNELHLFSGAGGGILGGMLLGHTCVCAVEIEEYPRKVLLQRQRDGILPRFPIWDDIRTFDGKPWRGRVDIVAGGFPCQDISAAGKGEGIKGERSGLWSEMARIVREVRPRFVFVENSPLLVGRGLTVVLGDLAKMGYDARWGVLGADDVGAPHSRKRIWLLAYPNGIRTQIQVEGELSAIEKPWSIGEEEQNREVYDTSSRGRKISGTRDEGQDIARSTKEYGRVQSGGTGANDGTRDMAYSSSERHRAQEEQIQTRWNGAELSGWWATEPDVGRVVNGLASRVDRLKAIGNGQVPQVAATAWEILTSEINV